MIDPKEIEPMVDSAMSASERIDAVLNDLIRIIDKGKPITEVNPHSLRTLVQQAWNETTHNSTDIDCTVDATIIAEKARSIDLFQHIFSVHTQRDATKIQVSLNEDTLYISSDARSFQLENTERLFEYGVETQENVRLLLANARTFATLHGWDIYIDTHQHKLRIAISDIKVDNHCPSKLPE